MATTPMPVIGGKTLKEWDAEWTRLPGGLTYVQSDLRHKAGLFRILWDGRVMVLGKGADKKGGLCKRLGDFRRSGTSGRDHHAGRRVHEHLSKLEVEVLVIGSDAEAREVAKQLRKAMVERHRPAWTYLIERVPLKPTRRRRYSRRRLSRQRAAQ